MKVQRKKTLRRGPGSWQKNIVPNSSILTICTVHRVSVFEGTNGTGNENLGKK